MAKDEATGGVLTIKQGEGLCDCGCGTAVPRRFAQGHDAKLRGMLNKAFREGQAVKVVGYGKTLSYTAEKLLTEHGFPIPRPKAPRKPRSKAATAKAAARKAKTTTRKPAARKTKSTRTRKSS